MVAGVHEVILKDSAKEEDDVLTTETVEENIRYDEGGVPIIDGYSNGLGFTQALSKLPLGVSISRTKTDAAITDITDAVEEMRDLALANDSGTLLVAFNVLFIFLTVLRL